MVLRDKIYGDEFKIWWSTTCSKPGICSAISRDTPILWPIWFVHVWLLPRVVLSKWEVWLSPFLIIALLLSYFAYFLIIPLSWMDRFHGLLGAWERWLSPPRSHQGGDFPTARGDRLTTLRFALRFFLHHKHWFVIQGPNVLELQGSGVHYLWQISQILDMFNHPLVFPWLLGCFPLAGNQPLKPGVGCGKKYLRP